MNLIDPFFAWFTGKAIEKGWLLESFESSGMQNLNFWSVFPCPCWFIK